jgi:hypothetical protein
MRFCERAIERGRKPLLLCFNRPLADKLVALAPDGVKVNTYHGFVREMAEQCGVEINFKKADEEGFWRDIQEQLLAATLAGLPQFDCLVVDEGQDFKADWCDILQMFLADDSTQLWLEDRSCRTAGLRDLSRVGQLPDAVVDRWLYQGYAGIRV